MCLKLKHRFTACLIVALLLFSSACDKISIPSLSFEEKPVPRLPKAVTYAFSSNLINYSKTVGACGLPYTIPVGKIITDTFLRVGQDRFNGVQAEPPVGQAQGAPLNGYRVVVDLDQFAFDPTTGSTEEERYIAMVNLDLMAIYEDSSGTSLAQTPLTYQESVSLWTPALTSQSSSCNTVAIDGVVEEAAEILVKEMASVMPRLSQPEKSNPHQSGATTKPSGSSPRQAFSPSVQFRTKLVDANRNLVLEGGEAIVLLIEITNVSDTDIPLTYMELGGTPVLVKAFKQVVSLPVNLGSFKAGEKRTAEIRGRLGSISKASQGELSIGIILSEGIPPGTHSIRTEIQP